MYQIFYFYKLNFYYYYYTKIIMLLLINYIPIIELLYNYYYYIIDMCKSICYNNWILNFKNKQINNKLLIFIKINSNIINIIDLSKIKNLLIY